MNWNIGEPLDDEPYLFTIEHPDGGRSVKFGRKSDLWAGNKIIAFIIVPEPLGGRRMPIDPSELELLCKTLRPKQIADSLGLSLTQFYTAVSRYPELKKVWNDREIFVETKAKIRADVGSAGSL